MILIKDVCAQETVLLKLFSSQIVIDDTFGGDCSVVLPRYLIYSIEVSARRRKQVCFP